MGQTIAEALREEGREEGRRQAIRELQQTLRTLMRVKFGRVPRAAAKRIRASQDLGQLRAWVMRTAIATTLEDTGIGSDP